LPKVEKEACYTANTMQINRKIFLFLAATIFYAQVYANDDGVLHTFYALHLEADGRRVANINTSENVVLGTPITKDFKGRCQVSLVFESYLDLADTEKNYVLVLSVREVISESDAGTLGLPIDHSYRLNLDEQLQFNIQTFSGLVLSGNLKLAKVSRIELAE